MAHRTRYNLTSAFVCSQAAYQHFVSAGEGKVINIGSMYSLFGAPMVAAYSASKRWDRPDDKEPCRSLGEDNVQVNAVLPGWIDTDLTVRHGLTCPNSTKRC